MCNKEQLVGYLYEDLAASERTAFEGHLAGCAACRREIAELRQTRQHLTLWAPPDPELHFQVVQSARAAAPPPRRRLAFVPQWGLAAAAALLVLAGAAAIANVEMRYGPDGFVIRTGWAAPTALPAVATLPPARVQPAAGPAVATPPPAVSDAAASEQLKAELLTIIDRRLQEIERAQTAQVTRAVAAAQPGITAPELRKILAENESRQRTEMALQIGKVWKDFNATRASDLIRVQQAVGPELQRQQRSIEHLMIRAASQR